MGQGRDLDRDLIRSVEEFKEETDIDRVILFGSQVSGDIGRHSDVDLILVDPSFKDIKPFKRGLGLHKHWHSDLPVDFLCYTPEEFERLKSRISIVREAVKKGKPIKA